MLIFLYFCLMKHLLLTVLSLFALLTGYAQQTDDWQQALHQWLTVEDAEDSYSEETMELLEEYVTHPINLNQTCRDELEQLPFLSAVQVEGIIAYLDRYHPIRTLNELLMVRELDYHTRQLLRFFVTVGEEAPQSVWPRLNDVLTYGKHELSATGKIPFYERRGDQNGYLGYRYRHDLRYQFNYNRKIKWGLTAAQDAGEPFFANGNKWGYDHYSYYLQMRDIGRLKELNLGMFRVHMGMGLVMNGGFYLGKLASLQSLGRNSHTLTAHSSRSSANYLQGAAATIQVAKQWQVTAFASWRPIDATLNNNGTARTLLTTGYHRTPTEMSKRNNTHRTDFGGRLGWRKGTLYANVNAVFTHLNRDLQPVTTARYRQYAAQGNDFFNVSMDYGYNNYCWSLSGETAVSRHGGIAMLHTVGCKATEQLSLMLLHRYYDKRYTALHARSFSEGGHIQNEHGLYLGSSWQPSRSWLLQGYADYAHFAWPRYLTSIASDAFDALISVRYQHPSWTVDGRYRYHIRQRDSSNKQYIANTTDHRLRLGTTQQLSPVWSLRTQADGVLHRFEQQSSYGIMVSENVAFEQSWLRVNLQAGWFHTDDYDSRVYQYERSVLHDLNVPMYYGHGIRYSLLLQAKIGGRLTAMAKLGVTNYFDRSTIGSALQQIDHSSMTDLLVQLRYIF